LFNENVEIETFNTTEDDEKDVGYMPLIQSPAHDFDE
jgi:hypothetical protein